jgi:serine/threonine protein kinase
MEYVEGESLSAIVKRDGALAEDAAVQYIRQVALALEHIHAQQIMHLDVKPGNVMVRSKDNRPILIDFGLSKHYDAKSGEATSTTPVGISHGFAPMEQYKQGGVSTFSPETDIYSLGATLYYLVTGSVPPEAADVADEGLPALPTHLSVSVRTAIVHSMEDKRKNRPHSIKEFMQLLDGGGVAHPNDVVITPIVELEATRISVDDERTRFAPTRTYNVGDYYNENGVEGVVFQVWDGGRHGKIVSLDEAQLVWDSRVKYGFFSSSVGSSTGAFNKHDGRANTDKLMARGDSKFFDAAKWCRAKGDGWYLPAVEELKTIYINKSKINPALVKYGTKLKDKWLSESLYWSSTENDKFCAWGVNIASGNTFNNNKDYNNYVRAIYAF